MDIPVVTLGLPVYNGEIYLDKTIKCVLKQTYSNLELIIVDNASTDNTERICRKYAAIDSRIKYFKNSINIGVSANHNRVVELSHSKYFKWIAHDDMFSEDFVEKCVDVLESDPSIILCCTKTYQIDENDNITGKYQYPNTISSYKVHERYRQCLGFSHLVIGLFGVFRLDALKKTRLIESYIGSDRNLFTELSLIGRFFQVPEYLFYFRMHPQSYSYRYDKLKFKDHVTWWAPSKKLVNRCIYTKNSVEFLRPLFHSSITVTDRVICIAKYFQWVIFEGWARILEDFETMYLGRSIIFRKIAYILEYLCQKINK